jgi:hypothetical protein
MSFAEPCRLCIRYLAQFPGSKRLDGLFLSMNCADLEPGILRFKEDLVSVKTKENLGRILSSCKKVKVNRYTLQKRGHTDAVRVQNVRSSWMQVSESREVEDL